MGHSSAGHEDLPATWPFRAAGTILVVAMVWFCLGFAIEDTGDELAAHMPAFWTMILAAALLIAGGAAFNISKERRRKRTA